jgi:hypothetical protein
MIREMFHTQEKWGVVLTKPIISTNPESWLGSAHYFWYDEDDAHWWGQTAKRRRRYYEVYKATIDCENVLDTVFNEAHYKFWVAAIEKAIAKFLKGNKNITIKDLNDFLRDKGVYEGVDCVMFQDISNNPSRWIVKQFQYKKRIQMAVYNLNIIANFALVFDSAS